MFTGVIKLAQIDDYIAPSQSCIQPKIMKKDKIEEKATVTLNDCLACSGCITSAESILIEQMSVKKFNSFKESNENVYVIISPQSLISLVKYFKCNVEIIVERIHWFFENYFKNVAKVYELSLGIEVCHQLIFEEFQKKQKPILCSECPGWVCYAEKTLTDVVTNFMSEVKSPQQIMGQMIKRKYGKECKVVTIMPCFDKKLEAIRFEIEEKVKEVDLTLATNEIVDLIKQTCGEELFRGEAQETKSYKINDSTLIKNVFKDEGKKTIEFVRDQTSNGYIEYILSRLGVEDYQCLEVKNCDFKEYSFKLNGEEQKMAKCYGFRNIQKIVQLIKKNKCPYTYVEIMACPGGCFGGGGQVRYEGVKSKEIIAEFEEILKEYPIVDEKYEVDLSELEIDSKQIHVKYKPIEKSLTESVMNW